MYLETVAHRCDSCGGGEFLPGHAEQDVDMEDEQETEKEDKGDDENKAGTSSQTSASNRQDADAGNSKDNIETSSKTSTGKRATRRLRGCKLLSFYLLRMTMNRFLIPEQRKGKYL